MNCDNQCCENKHDHYINDRYGINVTAMAHSQEPLVVEQAAELVPVDMRKPGTKITFWTFDGWQTWQFQSMDVREWLLPESWTQELTYDENKIEDLQNQIDSIQIGGWAISQELGNDPHIGISQKALTNVIGYNNEPDSIRGRLTNVELQVGDGGSVDARIAQSKDQIIGGASRDYDTLGETEGKIKKEIDDRINAVRDEALSRISAIAVETNRAETAEQLLQEQYTALTQSALVIGTLPASGQTSTIYRVPGESSYSDYMWNGSSFVKMAEYDNAIDNEPTDESNNLVKSGGVAKIIKSTSEGSEKFYLCDGTGAVIALLSNEDVLKFYVDAEIENLKISKLEFKGEGSIPQMNNIDSVALNDMTILAREDGGVLLGIDSRGRKIGNAVVPSVYDNNRLRESEMMAVSHFGKNQNANVGNGVIEVRKPRTQLIISTDTHENQRAFERFIEATEDFISVTAHITLGDNTVIDYDTTKFANKMEYYSSLIRNAKKPVYCAIGNHEAGQGARCVLKGASDKQLFNWFVKPAIDNGWLREGEYVYNKPYYYHEFQDNTILITLYPFDDGNALASQTETVTIDGVDYEDKVYWKPIVYNSQYNAILKNHSYIVGDKVNVKDYDEYSFECIENVTIPNVSFGGSDLETYQNRFPKYKAVRSWRWFSQQQLTWFCNVLKYAANKGATCIIAQHFPFTEKGHSDMNSAFSDSYATGYGYYGYRYINDRNDAGYNTDIIAEIVNACMTQGSVSRSFQAKPSRTTQYRLDNTSSIPSFTFSYDFSSLNTRLKKVFYIGGHYHMEYIIEHDDYPQQRQFLSVAGKMSNAYGHVAKPNDEKCVDFDKLTVLTVRDEGIHLMGLGSVYTSRIKDGKLMLRDNEFVSTF